MGSQEAEPEEVAEVVEVSGKPEDLLVEWKPPTKINISIIWLVTGKINVFSSALVR